MDSQKRSNQNNVSKRRDLRSFLRSLAVLLLAVMVVFGTTFAWIEGGRKASTMGENCSVEAGAGLQFIGIAESDINGGILNLPNDVVLEDCSSVDGRNFFIPTTGSIRPENANPNESNTSNLVFRSGLDSDVNSKYISKDFIIKSLESPNTNGTTPIYIGSGSTFSCTGDAADRLKAFRVSINFNDGTDPVVICPGLTFEASRSHKAVQSINDSGTTVSTVSDSVAPMSDYFYGNEPVFLLPNGETRRVTVTLWLEGTDDACTSQNVAGKNVNMNLILSTEDKNMRTITFVDYSPLSWVKDAPKGQEASMYVVQRTSNAAYKMSRAGDGITYTASVPDTFTDIYFQRTTSSTFTPDIADAYNTWSTEENDDTNLSSTFTYYAIGRGQNYDGYNYGYWVKQGFENVIDVYLYDEGNALDGKDLSKYPFVYAFGYTSEDVGISDYLKLFGGFEMEYVGYKGENKNVFHMVLPAYSGLGLVFSANNDTDKTGNVLISALRNVDLTQKRSAIYIQVDSNRNWTQLDSLNYTKK